jgi:hypothetical protein
MAQRFHRIHEADGCEAAWRRWASSSTPRSGPAPTWARPCAACCGGRSRSSPSTPTGGDLGERRGGQQPHRGVGAQGLRVPLADDRSSIVQPRCAMLAADQSGSHTTRFRVEGRWLVGWKRALCPLDRPHALGRCHTEGITHDGNTVTSTSTAQRGCPGWDSNPHGHEDQRGLSPPRLADSATRAGHHDPTGPRSAA